MAMNPDKKSWQQGIRCKNQSCLSWSYLKRRVQQILAAACPDAVMIVLQKNVTWRILKQNKNRPWSNYNVQRADTYALLWELSSIIQGCWGSWAQGKILLANTGAIRHLSADSERASSTCFRVRRGLLLSRLMFSLILHRLVSWFKEITRNKCFIHIDCCAWVAIHKKGLVSCPGFQFGWTENEDRESSPAKPSCQEGALPRFWVQYLPVNV